MDTEQDHETKALSALRKAVATAPTNSVREPGPGADGNDESGT